ncbi:MAG: cation diffusion facilitator family transporter [bacterium]
MAESRNTVLVALVANVAIAVAKTGAGLLTMSSSMISEAAHSWADTMNQVFLLFALKRADRAPDRTHPFGYGKERYFWSLLAAVGIFVTGAVLSIMQGVDALLHGRGEISSREYLISYAVLALAFLLEGSSLIKALRQLDGEAKSRQRGLVEEIRKSPDPTVKTVASEDSAAVTGLVLAALGLALHQLTGSSVYDAIASIAIGVLLAWVAYALGRDTKEMLIGEAADPELRLDIISTVTGYDGVEALVGMATMQLGPENVLVAAKIDFHDGLTAAEIQNLAGRIEVDLHERFPTITHLYLDPTEPNVMEQTVAADLRRLVESQADGSPDGRTAAIGQLDDGSWRSESA